MRTKTLKDITWDDNWETYVELCQGDILSDYPDGEIGIVGIMCQLKGVLRVYDAYIKAVEAVFQRDICCKDGYALKKIKELKSKEIENLKNGKKDEELSDCIIAATNGYLKWYKMETPNRKKTSIEKNKKSTVKITMPGFINADTLKSLSLVFLYFIFVGITFLSSVLTVLGYSELGDILLTIGYVGIIVVGVVGSILDESYSKIITVLSFTVAAAMLLAFLLYRMKVVV